MTVCPQCGQTYFLDLGGCVRCTVPRDHAFLFVRLSCGHVFPKYGEVITGSRVWCRTCGAGRVITSKWPFREKQRR